MWFKWTKYSNQTNVEPKVLYEQNQGHWNVFRIKFTWSKYLGVAVFFRPKYRNSLVMKIYKRRSHHGTCLVNMADSHVSLTYSYNLHLGVMIQISEWGGSEKDGSTPSLHPKFWCYISELKSCSTGPTFWGAMIDTILLVSFSGSNPDIWFNHETEPFVTIRPSGCSGLYLPYFVLETKWNNYNLFIMWQPRENIS